MTGQPTGERGHHATLLPHQVAFIEQFFADPSKRSHLLQSDVGLGTSFMVVHLIKHAIETQRGARVLLFAPKMLLMQMQHVLTSNGVGAEVVDRFRYRELQDAAPAGDTVWPTSGVFLLTVDFARQADIAGSLAAVRWSLIVLLEAHLLRGLREQTVRKLVASSPDLRTVLIALPDVEDLPTFGLDHLQKTEWRRAQVLDHAGQPLIAQASTRLEVIEFQQEPAERQVQDALQNAVDVVRSTGGSASPLANILLRALRSSPPAAEGVVQRLLNRVGNGPLEIAHTESEQDDEADADEVLAIPDEGDAGLIEVLNRCLTGLESLQADSKLNALVQRLAAWQFRCALPEAICILTEFRSTLFYLQTELEQMGLRSYLLHGSMNFDERSRAILDFKERRGVLVAISAIAATGFDLPQLDVLIFYDLPRSPLMLHQLLGRVSRFGGPTPLDVKVLLRPDDVDPVPNAMLAKLRKLVVDEERTGIGESPFSR